jgi:hypothetical protein
MALIDRLIGRDAAGVEVANRIPGHTFLAVLAEVAGGRMTNAQGQAALESLSGAPLAGAEITDALSILNFVTAVAAANRPLRYLQVDAIIALGSLASRAPVAGYTTPLEVRAKLVSLGALAA